MRITTNCLGHPHVKRLAPSLDLSLDQMHKKNRPPPRPPRPPLALALALQVPQASLEASFQRVHQQAGQMEQMDFNSLI